MANQEPLPALEKWQALELGLIAFPMEPQYGIEQAWWQELAGTEPNSTRKRFARIDEGQFQGRALRLEIDPLRVIWKVGATIDEEHMDQARPPTAGPFVETRDWFVEIMARWLTDMCAPITRLAFIGQLMLPTETREAAYAQLDRLLPGVAVDPATTEFQYRLNRKRQATTAIPDLTINRLAVWSAIKIRLQLHAKMPSDFEGRAVIDREHNGCMLRLDINTMPEFQGPLPAEHVQELWQELARLGSEIAEHGDLP